MVDPLLSNLSTNEIFQLDFSEIIKLSCLISLGFICGELKESDSSIQFCRGTRNKMNMSR